MADRLKSFGDKNLKIIIIPNALSFEEMNHRPTSVNNNQKKVLLFFSRYYAHKNLEIIVELSKKILDRKLQYEIWTTIGDNDDYRGIKLLKQIKKEGLDTIVKNIGLVQYESIPQLFEKIDALLMPTLLESYSRTYIEAMYYRKPILTSNLDFAVETCGNGATYFDPSDANDILAKIQDVFKDPYLEEKVNLNKQKIMTMLDWNQLSEKLTLALLG
jgi:glycosyltransferase involved in cell wall biosynthesis